VDSLITVQLQHQVGEKFTVRADLSVWGRGAGPSTVRASAVLRFAGLPAGAAVTSCQGYSLPVPTRTASWGQVKARYR
jgi:hypothetical protein